MPIQYATNEIANGAALPLFSAGECAELQVFLLHEIPLAAAMEVQVYLAGQNCHASAGICMTAPLAPNINDKGSAFGGATAGLMTLAGWGWLWLANRQLGLDRDIVIASSELNYQQPVYESLRVACGGPCASDWQIYMLSMQRRGRARLQLSCELRLADATLAAVMTANYATLKEPSP